MRYNRLAHFQNNPAALAKFRLACRLLYDIGADTLLHELNARKEMLPSVHLHTRSAIEENALLNQRSIGYAECLENMFSLDTLGQAEDKVQPAPDFGAIDRMVADGRATEEEAEMLRQLEIDARITGEWS